MTSAVVQHDDVLRERHHGAHHVLDEQDREPLGAVELAEHLDHLVALGGPQAGHHLVEQQQLRPGGERARDLQPLAVGQRQRRGQRIALGRRGPAARGLARRGLFAAATPRVRCSAPTTTLSSTDSPANGFTIWKVRPMPAAHTWSGRRPEDAAALEADLALARARRRRRSC
jgi:hypothetical protein